MATKSKTAKSKTTKTKPAKKPATKPAGASVKPKQTKTVKTTTKSTSTTTTKAKGKGDCRKCEIIFGVIMIILAIAIIAGVVACCIIKPWQKNDEIVMVESGKGNQIATNFVNLPNSDARILIPQGFKALSDTEINELKKAEGSEDTNMKAAYVNEDKSVLIYFTESEDDASDAEIKEGIDDLAKIFKEAGIKDIKTNTKTVDGRTVGTMQFSGLNTASYPYQNTAFFSNNGKIATVAFSCKNSAAEEWEKVGEAIIGSLSFNK